MTRRRKIWLLLLGFVLAMLISIPLIQRLSIDLMELQYRERILSDTATLGSVADGFQLPLENFARPLGVEDIDPNVLRGMTLDEIARKTGRPLGEVKRTVAEVAIGDQVGDAYGWTFWIPARNGPATDAR